MIVNNIMTKNPLTVHSDCSVSEARTLMDKEKISCLPVLDKSNRLIGIATKEDFIKAGPSMATTLDMYEISYLLTKLKVEKIMSKKVFSVQDNEVIEEAARIMADNDINCLPVLRGQLLVGIITVSDLFEFFVKAFGARHHGVRFSFSMPEKPGQLAKLTAAIAAKNGNIVAFVSQEGDDLTQRKGTLKITGIEKSIVEQIAQESEAEVVDIR
ncbi:MAG: CBS and ACT domain-containing protein [Termitinemataceae bacterium]|nr:MAG: CBS and ACT domain-containing protein [Termitinemataceae bacterium]